MLSFILKVILIVIYWFSLICTSIVVASILIFYFINLQEAARNNNGKAAHSAWRNYDDFNEYFWFTFLKILYPGLVPRL